MLGPDPRPEAVRPGAPPLRGEVHVWDVRLACPSHLLPALSRLLSEDERDRARRFHFARDRRRFVVARATLRRLLAGYAEVEPETITFAYGPFGKPSANLPASRGIDFNVTHSEDLAVFAFGSGRLGVDVEAVRELPELEPIARRFFSPRECEALIGLPRDDRIRGFFDCWTRKEAYLKALGDGMARSLARFAVTLGPGQLARLIWVEDEPSECDRWSLYDFQPAPTYAAALAAQGPVERLTFRSLEAYGGQADQDSA